jgi:formate transporter FocA
MLDSLLPAEMAKKAEEVGVTKAKMGTTKTLVLSALAGAFIAFGAIFSTTVTAGSNMSYGMTRFWGGFVFSLGLILVIVGSAELFTGNNLIVMAWASGKVNTLQILRNWLLVFSGNMFGAISIAVLMFASGQYLFGGGAVGANALAIAKVKCELGFMQAIVLGILCNVLVCLAVWLCFSAQTVTGKILSIIFPISAFVAAGFEHSVANMYYIPIGILLKNYANPAFWGLINSSADNFQSVTWQNFIVNNLLPVTIGNIIGGAVLVGLVYWFVFLRETKRL